MQQSDCLEKLFLRSFWGLWSRVSRPGGGLFTLTTVEQVMLGCWATGDKIWNLRTRRNQEPQLD